MSELFDLENTKDLPEEILKIIRIEMRKNDYNSFTKSIRDLFYKKNTLSLDEVIVALYRQTKNIPSRRKVLNSLSSLSRKILKKIGTHLYRLEKD